MTHPLIILSFFLSQLPALCTAQELQGKDSLFTLIQPSLPDDTVKVENYLRYGESFETENPDSAIHYYEKARDLAVYLDYKRGVATYISYYVFVLLNQGNYEKALALNLQALDIYKNLGSPRDIAVVYNNIANCYDDLGNIRFALENYLLAHQYFSQTDTSSAKSKYAISITTNNIGGIYLRLDNIPKAYEYITRSYALARQINDKRRIGSSLVNLSLCEQKRQNYAIAIAYCDSIARIGEALKDYPFTLDALTTRGGIYNDKKNFSQAASQFRSVIRKARENKDPNYEYAGWQGLAASFKGLGQWPAARDAVEKALAIASRTHASENLMQAYHLASEISGAQGTYKDALGLRMKYETLNDSLLGEKARQDMRILDIRYQTSKKELELQNKNILLEKNHALIRQQSVLNIALVAGCLLLLSMLLLIYMNLKNKQQLLRQQEALHKQRMLEMEKERRLIAMQSVMKGQEEERGRLARDLHDGVGGLLSGVKLSLSTMKGNAFLSEQHAQSINNVLTQLDQSISELRRVSHNMMPEALIKFGLKEALENYCENINLSHSLTVKMQTYGMEQRMDQSTEIVLYRIVQELLNNVIKHAEAKTVLIQLIREGPHYSLTVEDDGKGFNMEMAETKGAGLANIRARVNYLDGTIDFHSVAGEGTSVNIEGDIPSDEG